MIKNSFSFFIIVSLWYNRDIKIGSCKGDIQHEESLLSGFAGFNNSVRIAAFGSSLHFCNISNAKETRSRGARVQIFGEVPEIMGQAAAAVEQYAFDFLDINMGCPAPLKNQKHKEKKIKRQYHLHNLYNRKNYQYSL